MTAVATKPKTKRGPRGPYKKRKMSVSDTATTEKPVPTESSFMEGLRKTLTARDTEITERVNAIDAESAKLAEERATLVDEQEKVQSGLAALGQ